MIDIHCHMLPAIDDGPQTLDDALALAWACAEDGIRHVVLTPHVFPGRYDNDRASVLAEFGRFRAELAQAGVPITVSVAGEVRLMPEMIEMLAAGDLPFLGHSEGKHNLLLELPDGQIPLGTDTLVRRLLRQGVRPVIVHPERNRAVMSQPERMRPFVEAGCLLQLTAGSLTGHFGARAQAVAAALLEAGLVAVVASDSHNLKQRRPQMRAAREWLVRTHGVGVAFELLAATPATLCGLPPALPWHQEAAQVAGR